MRHLQSLLSVALLLLAALPHAVSAQAEAAGVVTAVSGSVQALTPAGIIRVLREDDEVFAGERIETARRSSIALEFRDETVFELSENSSMVVESYNDSENAPSLTTRVLGGVFRFVSGLIAKRQPEAMSVQLSVATIGIRGTNVVGEVGPESATIVLLEPEAGDTPQTAILVSNQFGSVVVDQPGWGTEIPDANSPPSPPRRMALRTIQNLMRTLQSVGRVRVPNVRF
ncbi:MAG: FecR domain-containing protein [Planctomycetes bacterium]|nr:FecR domain-containing protein [Planctomycetota bacterium]